MARVVVDVMLKPEILDPQGRAVMGAFGLDLCYRSKLPY